MAAPMVQLPSNLFKAVGRVGAGGVVHPLPNPSFFQERVCVGGGGGGKYFFFLPKTIETRLPSNLENLKRTKRQQRG